MQISQIKLKLILNYPNVIVDPITLTIVIMDLEHPVLLEMDIEELGSVDPIVEVIPRQAIGAVLITGDTQMGEECV